MKWVSLVVQLVKNPLQCGRPGFDPWVGKIPWRREWLPTPVFWPREFHGLYSPWGCNELDTTKWHSLSLLKMPMQLHGGKVGLSRKIARIIGYLYFLEVPVFCSFLFFFNFLIFLNFYFILLYNTVLVLPYIDMNPPRVKSIKQWLNWTIRIWNSDILTKDMIES